MNSRPQRRPIRFCHPTLIARLRAIGVAVCAVLAVPPASPGVVIEEISFESGAIGPGGSPASTGWQFDPFGIYSRVDTVNSNRGSFTNGTNQEAFLINPYIDPNGALPAAAPGQASGAARDRQGAVWEVASDATGPGGTETFDAGEVLYIEMEHFSDVSRSGSRFKTQVFIGALGDGISGQGGFGAGAFDSTTGAIDASLSLGDDESTNGGIPGGDLGAKMEHAETRWVNPPTSADMEANHTTIQVFRHGVDAASMFTGTELEINDTLGAFNGGDGPNATDPDWGGDSGVITGLPIDKIAIFISRIRTAQTAQALAGETFAATSSWLDQSDVTCGDANGCFFDAQIGIKYLKVGTADKLDVNLDGVVDAADRAIVQANQGLGPGNNPGPNSTGATFFDGDVDNDLDVDADDLAAFPSFGLLGDANGDGVVNTLDIDPFVQALTDPAGYMAAFPAVDFLGNNDINMDGVVNTLDIDPFVAILTGPGAGNVPEPTAILFLATGLLFWLRRRRR